MFRLLIRRDVLPGPLHIKDLRHFFTAPKPTAIPQPRILPVRRQYPLVKLATRVIASPNVYPDQLSIEIPRVQRSGGESNTSMATRVPAYSKTIAHQNSGLALETMLLNLVRVYESPS